MSSSTPNLRAENREQRTDHPTNILPAAVLTVSDSCAKGENTDLSGPAVVEVLTRHKFSVMTTKIVPDDTLAISNAIVLLTDEARLDVTTGGTGIAQRDVTPEATRMVCTRIVEGIAEHMRAEGMKKTPLAALSRGICGVREKRNSEVSDGQDGIFSNATAKRASMAVFARHRACVMRDESRRRCREVDISA